MRARRIVKHVRVPEIIRQFGQLTERVRTEPATITKNGRDRLIVCAPVYSASQIESQPVPGPVSRSHGSMTGTPAAMNGAVSRVATEKPWAAAIAAI
jgi:hypothetical protein